MQNSIKFDLMAGAFAGGDAEYVTLFEPTASMTQLAGKGYVVASVGEASGEIPYTAYFAKKSYIQNNEDVIQGFTYCQRNSRNNKRLFPRHRYRNVRSIYKKLYGYRCMENRPNFKRRIL